MTLEISREQLERLDERGQVFVVKPCKIPNSNENGFMLLSPEPFSSSKGVLAGSTNTDDQTSWVDYLKNESERVVRERGEDLELRTKVDLAYEEARNDIIAYTEEITKAMKTLGIPYNLIVLGVGRVVLQNIIFNQIERVGELLWSYDPKNPGVFFNDSKGFDWVVNTKTFERKTGLIPKECLIISLTPLLSKVL